MAINAQMFYFILFYFDSEKDGHHVENRENDQFLC